MAAALLSRTRGGGAGRFIANKLLNPCYTLSHHHHHHHSQIQKPHLSSPSTCFSSDHPNLSQTPFIKYSKFPSPQPNFINPNLSFNSIFIKSLSTSSPSSGDPKEEPKNPIQEEEPKLNTNSDNKEFKHQEIEGPTVDRDLSTLANEMRRVHEKLMKTIYSSSKALGIVALLHLSCGAWTAYTTQSSPLQYVSIQSFAAFAFPFSLAFMLRQSLKPIAFFRKMEQMGRLQILTLALQVTKALDVFFVRVRGVSLAVASGMVLAFLFTLVFSK